MRMEQRGTEVAQGRQGSRYWRVQLRVVRSDLSEFDGTGPAEHLARLEADQRLMLRLSLAGFAGSVWEGVARALVEYGRTVMSAWIATGVVFAKCREKGIVTGRLEGPGRPIWGQDAEDLTEDTVAMAIIAFRDRVLRGRRWDPARGASLATFFIGMCLLQFPNVYRAWRREYLRSAKRRPLDGLEDEENPVSTAAEAIGAAEADRLLARLPVADRVVAFLLAQRFTVPEIATLTGRSEKAVEGRIYRLRRRMRRESDAAT
jgi:DNA-directed RNA polymerase specialized sigma24 family protein